jgi:hypothetical protein
MLMLMNTNCIIQPNYKNTGGLYMGNIKGAKDLKTL